MKLIHLSASMLAAVFAFASLVPATQAQRPVGRINVPFAFDCGATHYPAGVYTIRSQGEHIASIQGPAKMGLVMMKVDDSDRPSASKATFVRYGDSYFLRSLSSNSIGARFNFIASATEAQARRDAQSPKPNNVQIALLSAPR
jgi:hypothetical protein